MVSDVTKQTETTVAHHLEAVMSGDLNTTLSDYAEESILFTSKDPVRRLHQLRSFMEVFLSNLPPGMEEIK